jgi:hypothetical protein
MVSLPEASITAYALPTTLRALRKPLAVVIPDVEGLLGERLAWNELTPGRSVRVNDVG